MEVSTQSQSALGFFFNRCRTSLFLLGKKNKKDIELDSNRIEGCLEETRNSWWEQSLTLNRHGTLNIVGLAY